MFGGLQTHKRHTTEERSNHQKPMMKQTLLTVQAYNPEQKEPLAAPLPARWISMVVSRQPSIRDYFNLGGCHHLVRGNIIIKLILQIRQRMLITRIRKSFFAFDLLL